MKNKESSLKTRVLVGGHDNPTVKGDGTVFMIPDLEVIVHPSKQELVDEWYSGHPNWPLEKQNLWGFYDITDAPPMRIHLRSVRSHGSKQEFLHTLGHELAHILEQMERIAQPAKDYKTACRNRIVQDAKAWWSITWFEATENKRVGKALKHIERTVDRIHEKIRKEH